ncbi:MAG: dephospho-CoA kinase [Fibrobacterota bacterium]
MIVGITGNICSGKSLAAKFLEEKGMKAVYADKLGHQILENDPVISAKLAEAFPGRDIADPDGNIIRKELGRVAFMNKENLEKLNSIIHPVLVPVFMEEIRNAAKFFNNIAAEAALIFEWKIEDYFDTVITVTAPPEVRIRRLSESGKISLADAEKRVELQGDDSEKKSRSDFVIENTGTLTGFQERVYEVWEKISAG